MKKKFNRSINNIVKARVISKPVVKVKPVKATYHYQYSRKADYKAITREQFRGMSQEQQLKVLTGMKAEMRKRYYRMEKAEVNSIRMGQIRSHYNIKDGDKFKTPSVRSLIDKRDEINGRKNAHKGKIDLTKAMSEFDFLNETLNDEYYSITGARQELENTIKTLEDRGIEVEPDFDFNSQDTLWKLYSEFRDFKTNVGSPKVLEIIKTEMASGDALTYEELKSNIYLRLQDEIRTNSMAADILNH